MPEFVAGTYPYAKRQAIADAVQAVLQLHTQQTEGDVSIRGAVTVVVRVTVPEAGVRDPNWDVDAELAKTRGEK